jgi:adenine-specific DNA methylase
MKTALFFMAVMVFSGATYGQARKCTGPDGKVTYSDVLCSTAGTQTTINTSNNTIDSSGARRDAQKYRDDKDEADAIQRLEALRQSNPVECRFAYQAHGDAKGKKLAGAAKEECLREKNGMSNSKEAYNRWSDHRQATKVTICSSSGMAIGNMYSGAAVCR